MWAGIPSDAEIGVPEVWRYDGATLEIVVLQHGQYVARLQSQVFPALMSAALAALLPASMGLGDIAWIKRVREWVRIQVGARARDESGDGTGDAGAGQP